MTYDLEIATDGSCIQSGSFRSGTNEEARPGAWGFIGRYPDGRIIRSAQPEPNTTIGAMEVTALLRALEFVASQKLGHVVIQCDSLYVVNGYNDWVEGWAKKNFTKKGGLAHAESWRKIYTLKHRLFELTGVTVEWVKAHQNNGGLNDMADELANTCARTQQPVELIQLSSNTATGQSIPDASTEPASEMSTSQLIEEDALLQFRAIVTATAEVEETWLVSARDEDHLREIIDDGLLHEHTFLEQRILGNERDRELDRAEAHIEPEISQPVLTATDTLIASLDAALAAGPDELFQQRLQSLSRDDVETLILHLAAIKRAETASEGSLIAYHPDTREWTSLDHCRVHSIPDLDITDDHALKGLFERNTETTVQLVPVPFAQFAKEA